jgi:hypothetical protein
MRLPLAIALGGLFLAPSVAQAADAPSYPILGAGNLSCGAWKEHRSNHDELEASMKSWVLGFITAENVWNVVLRHSAISATTDADGLFGWIDNYCAAHPLETVSAATLELSSELIKTPNGNLAR